MTTKLPASIADLKQVLEAALLTTNQPLSLDDMTRLFVERVERTSLRMLLDELKQDWAARSMEIVLVATGYRFQARVEFAPFLARLNPERQLKYSRAVMETLAIILLVTPVLLPVMTAYGVDPIHFGIIMICCVAAGFSTPPLGENMFIASGISNRSLEEIAVKAFPFVIIQILVIAILIVFPDLVLYLPSLIDVTLQ